MRLRWWRRPKQTFDAAPRPIDQLWLEMLGSAGENPTVSRTEALSVPAVQRGRNMICSIATLPLVQYGPDRTVVPNPLFEQLDPDVPNVATLAQTVEDLLFDGIAWWRVTGFGWDGYPVQVRRLDPGTVSLQPPGDGKSRAPLPSGQDPRGAVVWVDGKPVPAREMIRFDSPNPAVLKVGGRAIRRAILLDQAARMYADDPRPLDYFTPAEGADPADDDDITDVLNRWKAARKQRGTAFVPAALKYNTVDVPSPADLQLVELQKQAGLDIANALGIDPENLGISTTSRTYQNATDRRQDRINDVLAPYMRAVTDRLSMRDVTKRGHRVGFDLDDYMKADPATRWGVYSTAKGLGVMDVDTIAGKEGLPAPAGAEVEPAPVPVDEPPADLDANTAPTHTFDGSATTFTADLPMETFAVDLDSRTIEGIAMPYGPIGSKGGMKFRFDRGSLEWSDVGRVKLLRDHGTTQPLGRAVALKHTSTGLAVKFKVARGVAGDEALLLAEDGVLDGLSAGVDFDLNVDTTVDAKDRSVTRVRRATLREVSLTAVPAFDDARVTVVRASRDEEAGMPEETETAPETMPAATTTTFTADQFEALLARLGPAAADDGPQLVDPTRPVAATVVVREALPYRFDRGGNFAPVPAGGHVFSADLHEMALARDHTGQQTDAGKRVMGLLAATFDTDAADVNELNPTINRPDMYVDQVDYKYPIWAAISKGAPPNGVQPFGFPKFNTASGLVGDHTEGTEPTAGAFTTTSQTVTPTPVSGKASITREVWDMGGNPAVSTLIFNQMVRGWREGLESAAATFLNTLTAATDITLTAGATDETLAGVWDAALAELAFARGYDFSALVLEKVLYKTFVAARDTAGRVLYPILAPQNTNGTASARFRSLDLGGVTGLPSWALASTAGSANNSWLFDPMHVHGWASAPQRLEFPGSDTTPKYAPVAYVDLAIWGYKALANSDIGAVRQVIYDSVA